MFLKFTLRYSKYIWLNLSIAGFLNAVEKRQSEHENVFADFMREIITKSKSFVDAIL